MGALSSCCAVEESKDKASVEGNSARELDKGKGGEVAVREDVAGFQARLEKGISMLVLLQDGTKLPCILCFSAADCAISISCDDKVRVIPISDIKQLLDTKEQLWRVETKANLVEDPNCVALHLAESGNCIPIRFEKDGEKANFTALIQSIKATA